MVLLRCPGKATQGLQLTSATVSSADDSSTNQKVVIKKIRDPFSSAELAKRTYREIHLLRNLRHGNVRTIEKAGRSSRMTDGCS